MMQDKAANKNSRNKTLLGGHQRLLLRLRASGIATNIVFAVSLIGGYLTFAQAGTVKIWAVLIPFLIAGIVAAALLHYATHRLTQKRLIAVLNGEVEPNNELLDHARRGLLAIPWQACAIDLLLWSIAIPTATFALRAAGSITNDKFDPALVAFALVPVVSAMTLFTANKDCQPYRMALFTGVDLREFNSPLFLDVGKRFMICLLFTMYALVLCVLLVLQIIYADPSHMAQRLPPLLASYVAIAVLVMAFMSFLALQNDPLESASGSSPDARDALSGAYAVEEEIGRGAMGIIYRARHKLLDKTVAVKMLEHKLIGDIDAIQRFRLEARAASRLHHQNIVSVLDFGVLPGGRCFLVLDYIDGKSLSDVLETKTALPAQEAIPIFIQLCDALSHAHKNNVLHRDLKPSNVMVTNSTPPAAMLVDFGIAKLLDEDQQAGSTDPVAKLTKTGQSFGTPAYMSPEQCCGEKLDERSDIYSMGCMMYQLLSGELPYTAINDVEMLYKQLNEPAPRLPVGGSITRAISDLIGDTLSKEPSDRPASAEELKRRLQEAQALVT